MRVLRTIKCVHLIVFMFTTILVVVALSSHETKLRLRKLFRKKMEALDPKEFQQLFQESQQIAAETKEKFASNNIDESHNNAIVDNDMNVVIENPEPAQVAEEVELKLVAQEHQHAEKEPIPVEEIPADNSE